MGATGTKAAKTTGPDAMVKVTGGIANPTTVTIPPEGTVQIEADADDYLLEFYDKTNKYRPSAMVQLPANGSITVVGGSDAGDKNSEVPYNVKFYTVAGKAKHPSAGKVLTGGGNKIIIGSGNAIVKRKKK
jgi:hypothetical protein